MTVSHWLNRTLTVWREGQVADGTGGYASSYESQGTVSGKVDQSTGDERILAQQAGAEHTHNIYLEPDAAVYRNDLLADAGVDPNTDEGGWYHVKATTTPSSPRYLKAESERVERAQPLEESS